MALVHGRLIRIPFRVLTRSFALSSKKLLPIRPGETLPDVTVYEGTPDKEVNIADLFRGKKGVLFSVPGAFNPSCSKVHLPGYIQHEESLKHEGYDVIACLSVNDPFVMDAWSKQLGADGKIHMLADMKCEFTKAIGMELDATRLLGNYRSKRYMMLVEDSVVQHISSEVDDSGLACLLCIRKMKRETATR